MSQFIKHPNNSGVLINLANITSIRRDRDINTLIILYCTKHETIYNFTFSTQEERDLYYRTLEQYLLLDIGL